jgi:alcohol dehydrogenase
VSSEVKSQAAANTALIPLPLLTHRFKLDQIVEAYDLFGSRREGVLKVAIRP